MRSLVMYIFLVYSAFIINECSADPKVVGGEAVTIEEFPYQVSLQYRDRHICGGSIISSKWILTAAHCVHGAGSAYHNRLGFILNTTAIISHHMYNTTTTDYDICVIKLLTSLVLGLPNVNSVVLAGKNYQFKPGALSLISGWGFFYSYGIIKVRPDELQAAEIPLIDRKKCKRLIMVTVVTDRMVCAGYMLGGSGSSRGDSGGPLVVKGVQVGIASWGTRRGVPTIPGVYSNVAELREWIWKTSGV